MAGLSFNNKLDRLWAPPDYSFSSIVYVRGTKEGYSLIENQATNFLQSKKQQTKTLNAAKGMVQRYVNLQQQNPLRKTLGQQDILKMQEEYVAYLNNNIHLQQSGQKLASTMQVINKTIWSLKDNKEKSMAEEIMKLVEKLEQEINALTTEQQKGLIALMDPKMLEGEIVKIKEGQLAFERIKTTINRLSALGNAHPYTFMVNMNRELGAINEAVTVFSTNLAQKTVEENLLNKTYTNGKMIHTGTQTSINETGTAQSTAKSDAIFTYSAQVGGQQLNFQFGISLKLTQTVFDQNGNWVLKPKTKGIQIASIKAQEQVWQMLKGIYGGSTLAENALLNALAWSSSNSNNIKMIKKNLIANYFEKLIAGSGGLLSGGSGIDLSDALIINGRAFPMISIIALVAEKLQSNENNNIITTKLVVDNSWKGDEKNREMAIQRSNQARKQIKNNLQFIVNLSGSQLQNIAKFQI